MRLDRELPVGVNPVAVTASPTRNEVYVVNKGACLGHGSVSVINAENNTVAATIPVGGQPVALALNPEWRAGLRSQLRVKQHLRPRPEDAAAKLPSSAPANSRSLSASLPITRLWSSPTAMGNSVSIIDPATGMLRAVFSGCPAPAMS